MPNTYLADSQFDYPGRPHGWRYYALSAQNEFAHFEPVASSAGTATPLTFLGCDDPNARVGRDSLHPGYQRRPCLQWNPREAGTYRLEGEVALMRSSAAGELNVRVIVDDVEMLQQDLSYPQVLDFSLEVGVRAGGFVRVLFSCRRAIDHNDTLYYLRASRAATELPTGEHRMSRSCAAPPGWSRLAAWLGGDPGSPAPALAGVAQGLFDRIGQPDPALVELLQQGAAARFHPKLKGYRKPRFFSIQPQTADHPAQP